jgi:hypothetical protein
MYLPKSVFCLHYNIWHKSGALYFSPKASLVTNKLLFFFSPESGEKEGESKSTQ